MQQYFINKNIEVNDTITFDEKQEHHIMRVLRMKSDSVVKLVDINQNPFLAHIQYLDQKAYAKVFKTLDNIDSSVKIRLIQGMIKKDKWDFLIQKCCELGVHEIVPMISSRTIVKVDANDTKKLERYNKIALEACEQCKRNDLVQVYAPIKFKDIKQYKSELNIVAYEDVQVIANHIKHTLTQYPDIETITFVIGSEGGFSELEIQQLVEEEFHCVSLGQRILRAETAAMMVVNLTQYHYETK